MGKRSRLFWLALKTGFLSILTLGFYRFWMKTRLRRYFWSAIRPGGHPLEYVGDPIEKLLGFFIAVVVLTFYIGIVNLILMFVSFSVFEGNGAGYLASFAGVIPLWFYARWRARRYVLGRTRWRGVRFALEPAAWRYTGRALIHWAITICTLGLLWPRMTFALEKFRTDHTLFGDHRLNQGGRWPMLYRAAIPLGLVIMLIAAFLLWIVVLSPLIPDVPVNEWIDKLVNQFMFARWLLNETSANLVDPARLWAVPVLFALLLYGVIHYVYVSRRIMADHKSMGGVKLNSSLSPRRVAAIYVFGYFIAYLVLVLGILLLIGIAIPVFGMQEILSALELDIGFDADFAGWIGYVVLGLVYFGVFLMWSVCYNTFFTFPLMRHMAATLSLIETQGLNEVSQRKRDEFAEAEGFAEALDLGAAI